MDYKNELEELVLNVIHENGSDLHLGASRVPAIRVSGELIFLVKHAVITQEDMLGFLAVLLDTRKVEKFKKPTFLMISAARRACAGMLFSKKA